MKSLYPISLSLFLLSLGLAACSGKKVDENDPAAMYQDAQEEIESEHYQIAIDKLRVVKNKFPYSKFSIEAQLRIADVYFLQDNFLESATSYEGFVDLHPKHEKVEYALFRAGLSYEKDSPSNIARDLTSATKALSSYNEYVRRFGQSTHIPEAKKSIAKLREVLAEKELYVGDFYKREDDFDQAKNRYNKILVSYPETEAAKKAKTQMAIIEGKK